MTSDRYTYEHTYMNYTMSRTENSMHVIVNRKLVGPYLQENMHSKQL